MAPYALQIMQIFQTKDPFAGLTNYDNLKCRKCHDRPMPPGCSSFFPSSSFFLFLLSRLAGMTEEIYDVLTDAFNLFTSMQFNATSWTLSDPFLLLRACYR